MIRDMLRSHGGLVESLVLQPTDDGHDALVSAVREHWATLRAKGLAAATPVQVLAGDEDANRVVYVFRWLTETARDRGRADEDVLRLMEDITTHGSVVADVPGLNEVYQGFDYKRFPDVGGLELLKGKCNCVVDVQGAPMEVELDVSNGFVLMHRAPGRDVDADGNREMYVRILDHGGDCPNQAIATCVDRAELEPGGGGPGGGPIDPAGGTPGDGGTQGVGSGPEAGPVAMAESFSGAPIRVGQNKELPQYGLIRANEAGRDFPATAMWVVHWRIWTAVGTLITDPDVPLVFGPTTVEHYPPVGTEFHSSNGPVKLIHEDSGSVVGTLTPRELTAFDIVVTKDDEIASPYLEACPEELVRLFNARTAVDFAPALA